MNPNLGKVIGLMVITLLMSCGDGGDVPQTNVVVTAEDALNEGREVADGASTDANSNSDPVDQNNDAGQPEDTGQPDADTEGTSDVGASAESDPIADTNAFIDSDADGMADSADNCPFAANPDQLDNDEDGVGDACDSDDDADTIADSEDNCPLIANPEQLDNDQDGFGDDCESDDDNDAVFDSLDNCPLTSNPEQLDENGDGVGDACTTDSDTSSDTTNDYAVGSLASMVLEHGELGMAFAALEEAGLVQSIDDPAITWTIFLPTDKAMAESEWFDIQRHIHTGGAFTAADLSYLGDTPLIMNDGQSMTLTGGGAQPVMIADATIVTADMVCDNSKTIVHVIDKVLSNRYPEGSLADVLESEGTMSQVMKGLRTDGFDRHLNDPDNDWTWFLPNDEVVNALDNFPKVDLMGHVYDGVALDLRALTALSGITLTFRTGGEFEVGGGGTEPLTIGGATVVKANVKGNTPGPTVHIIDNILMWRE